MRKTRHKGVFVSILLIAIFFVAFGSTFFVYQNNESDDGDETLTVVTSFYPMYIAAMNVTDGIDGISLQNLSEPQTGCLHDYQLTPEDMKLLSTADVFVVNGGGVEEFLVDVAEAYPELVIIDASDGIETIDDNGHVWMSPLLHQKQVENIAAGLSDYDEKNADIYESNAAAYTEKLQALVDQLEDLSWDTTIDSVILFHEAYAYLADNLGIEVTYILDLDEERQVSAGEVAEVMSQIFDHGIRLVLAEETYGSEMGQMVVDETDADVIYLDTLVRGTYDQNSYLEKMQQNIDLLKDVLSQN